MDGHTTTNISTAPAEASSGAASKREVSSIAFPYNDLEAAISVARSLLNSGGLSITRDQMAAAMGLAAGSGNFVTRTAAARLFGLVEFAQSRFSLTDLGHAILDPGREKAARAEAFLRVPLYRKAYDEYRGKQLPPRPHGIEAAFVQFGVSPKQKDKARVAFEKSAAQAGYFGAGQDRLVEPVIPNQPAPEPAASESSIWEKDVQRQAMAAMSPAREYHPFVEGLLKTMPEPGELWPDAARKLWLATAENIFKMIYKDADAKEAN